MTTDLNPHTSAAMRTVALAQFLGVAASEIVEHGVSVRSHLGREYLVSDVPILDTVRLVPLGTSFGFSISEIPMEGK